MPPRVNPLKLNTLQAKTLVLFQELARHKETATITDAGEAFLSMLPQPHGNHFHVGHRVVMSKDATGLVNAAVWAALERKGLIRANYPLTITVTASGLAYDTGMADQVLHGSDH